MDETYRVGKCGNAETIKTYLNDQAAQGYEFCHMEPVNKTQMDGHLYVIVKKRDTRKLPE